MNKLQKLAATRTARTRRVRLSVRGTAARPRLHVFRSNAHIYAQVINDESGVTLVSATDQALKTGTKIEKAALVGGDVATKAKAKKVTKVVFDRGGNKYHGRIKALAEAARKAGLEF